MILTDKNKFPKFPLNMDMNSNSVKFLLTPTLHIQSTVARVN